MSLPMWPPLPGPEPARRLSPGALASACAHAACLAALLAIGLPTPFQAVPLPEAIEVELMPPPGEVAAPPVLSATVPAAAPVAPAASAATPASGPHSGTSPPAPADGLTEATRFYAAGILAEPTSRRLRQTLSQFADSEKIVQLCNIEGLEQIRRADPRYDPDVLVSYALADTRLDGLTLIADGAAFHDGRNWYGIRFRCTVAADYGGVVDFAFTIGDPVPRALWASHGLPEQYQDSE